MNVLWRELQGLAQEQVSCGIFAQSRGSRGSISQDLLERSRATVSEIISAINSFFGEFLHLESQGFDREQVSCGIVAQHQGSISRTCPLFRKRLLPHTC